MKQAFKETTIDDNPNLSEDSASTSGDKSKSSTALRYEKEHQFIPRNSYFDLCLDNTILQKSEFKGFFNLFGVLVLFYIIATPVHNMIVHKIPFKMTMFYKMIHD